MVNSNIVIIHSRCLVGVMLMKSSMHLNLIEYPRAIRKNKAENCFGSDSLVEVASNLDDEHGFHIEILPMGLVKLGQRVRAFDISTGRSVWSPVIAWLNINQRSDRIPFYKIKLEPFDWDIHKNSSNLRFTLNDERFHSTKRKFSINFEIPLPQPNSHVELDYQSHKYPRFLKKSPPINLTISPMHVIFRASTKIAERTIFLTPVFAQNLHSGDLVIVYKPSDFVEEKGVDQKHFYLFRVVKSDFVYQQEAYAPLTEHGTIFVNGVLVSCYDESLHILNTHLAFAPIRWLYRVSNYFKSFLEFANYSFVNSSIYFDFTLRYAKTLKIFLGNT